MDNREHREQKACYHSCVSLLLVSSLKASHYFIKEEQHKKQQRAFP